MLFAVQRGETVVSPGLAGRLLATRTSGAKSPYAMHAGLTVREDEIMVRVTEGLTNKEVARVLGLSGKDCQALHDQHHAEAPGPQSGRGGDCPQVDRQDAGHEANLSGRLFPASTRRSHKTASPLPAYGERSKLARSSAECRVRGRHHEPGAWRKIPSYAFRLNRLGFVPRTRCGGPLFAVCRTAEPGDLPLCSPLHAPAQGRLHVDDAFIGMEAPAGPRGPGRS